jgi:hypothetical protein
MLAAEELDEPLDAVGRDRKLLVLLTLAGDPDRGAQLVEEDPAGLTAGEMGAHPGDIGRGKRLLEAVGHRAARCRGGSAVYGLATPV